MDPGEARKISGLYEFSGFVLDPDERRLLRDGELVRLRPKSFDLLLALLQSPGSLRTRDELVQALWPEAVIEEHGLTVCVSALRKALEDDDEPPRFVETVRGHGYRFIAPVQVRERAPAAGPPPTMPDPDPGPRVAAAITFEAGAASGASPVPTAAASAAVRASSRAGGAVWWLAGLLALALVLGATWFWQRGGSSAPPASIAVLPFENIGGREADAYFANGIHQSLLTRLTHISGLTVISRTSSSGYGSHPEALEQVARQLGVATLLEGSVQRSGQQVLVNVQLLDPRDRRHLWSGSYKRTLGDVFEVENDIATQIAAALKTRLLPDEAARVARVPTRNPDAYQRYLKAIHHADKVVRSSTARVPARTAQDAAALFREAIALDPEFALAHAGLAELDMHAYRTAILDRATVADSARRAAEAALRLDPGLAEAHRAMGYVLYYTELDYDAALERFQQAEALSPNDPETLAAIAFIQRRKDDLPAALARLQQVAVSDPRNPRWPIEMGVTLVMQHRYAEAEQQFAQSLAIEPDNAACISFRARALLLAGQVDAADAALDQADAASDQLGRIAATRFEVAMLQRDPARALAQLEGLPDWVQATYYGTKVPTVLLRAEALALRGDADAAQAAYREAAALLAAAEDGTSAARVVVAAATGDRATALAQARALLELSPIHRDMVEGSFGTWLLARVHARFGEAEAAAALLAALLDTHSGIAVSHAALQNDPAWDPIRAHPAFQRLRAWR